MTALASLLCPPSIPPETGAAAGSGDSSLSNGMEVGHHHEIKPGKEEDYIHDDDEDDKGKGHHDGHSSSAHTDNEEFDPESKEAATIIITTSRKVKIQCNNNEVDGDKDATEKVVNDRVSFGGTQKPYTTSILKAYPPTNSSPRWGAYESRNDRHRDSYTDTSDSDDNHNNQESYASYKIGRKNLLKIEKLTDSDSRGREKMRSRALSPPSSSDEENLHIGWVAYPILPPAQTRRRKSRHRQKPVCNCVNAIRTIFLPVSKICHLCRTNRVGSSQTMIQLEAENGFA